ncbi:TIGR02301 family protein [Neorhizobium sp. NPDC001467]|uniref:TIGR02301 family protein n=1 Tax=Neorhizobium sp. NPDC001467 TaxID=3390595 RepID=UPI003D02FB55
MTLRARLTLCFVTASLALAGTPVLAQKKAATPPPPAESTPPVEKPAPYDDRLSRLSEILGSVHYLRMLCGEKQSNWRASMQTLIDSETANEPKRRERMTAAFNRGYRSFASVHTVCTPTARAAEEAYRAEGATLAAEIAARYGN